MCDSANLCVNFQAKCAAHRAISSHDLGYKDPQILSTVHTGVRAQWGRGFFGVSFCQHFPKPHSHIPNTFNTSYASSLGPSVFDLEHILEQTEREQSTLYRSQWNFSKHMEIMDRCHWNIHMCCTHLQHSIWLKRLWCLKVVPALRDHSSMSRFMASDFAKRDENDWEGNGRRGTIGEVIRGLSLKSMVQMSVCVYLWYIALWTCHEQVK